MARGRFAPSPTGTFHLGNLRTALAAWLFARSSGSEFVLRFEDLDDTAQRDHERSQLEDLARLGLDFDGPIVRQSARSAAYADAISDLIARNLTYPCWCSRKDIREAPAAPHGPRGAYPGTCRDLSTADRGEKESTGRAPALRLRAGDANVEIIDQMHGTHSQVIDDFVLRRGDGTPSYHLVVVIDDAQQEIEEVVRADDLLESTPRHAHLQSVLGLPQPQWAHVPLVVNGAGDRLAKRDGSVSLAERLALGDTPERVVGALAASLGINAPDDCSPTELVPLFDLDLIPMAPWILDGSTLTERF